MADGIFEISGPRYDINLADVGKQVPYDPTALTKAFQTATNLIETRWVNQNQYQLAQYGLQEAAAKLKGLDVDNDLQRQTFQQRAELFPMQKQAQQQSIDQNQIALDEQKYQQDQRGQANTEMKSWQSEMQALDPNDADFDAKRAEIDAKYPNAASSPFTQNQRNVILGNKLQQRQNSSQQKVRDFYSGNLTALQNPALPGGALINPHVDVNAEIAKGNGPALWQQAQQQEATRRLRALQARATDPTDRTMIGRLLNEVNNPPGGVSHFGADGTLDQTMTDQIGAYEQKYGVVNPYAGAKKTITTRVVDPKTGQVTSETKLEDVPVTGQDVKQTEPAVVAPPTYKYDLNKDPDFAAAKAKVLQENPNAVGSPGFLKRVQDEYYASRKAKGLGQQPTQDEINRQYQSTLQQNNPQPAGTNTTAVNPAPGSTVSPNINVVPPAIARPTPTPRQHVTTPAVGTNRRRGITWVFPEEEAPPGSWQKAWNDTVGGSLASNLSDENIQREVQAAEGRASFASAESGLPSWYRTGNEAPSPSPGDRGGGGNYTPPENAPAVAGISPNVWGMVMKEEGPEFGPDGKHPSVFGLWGDKPGVESDAYSIVRKYGAHSPEAYTAVTNAWTNGFLRPSQPWRLTSPGMQGLVISDSQHQGGEAAARIIDQMGGWDRINQMDQRQAIAEYSALRRGLWGSNQARVRREESWALANT